MFSTVVLRCFFGCDEIDTKVEGESVCQFMCHLM